MRNISLVGGKMHYLKIWMVVIIVQIIVVNLSNKYEPLLFDFLGIVNIIFGIYSLRYMLVSGVPTHTDHTMSDVLKWTRYVAASASVAVFFFSLFIAIGIFAYKQIIMDNLLISVFYKFTKISLLCYLVEGLLVPIWMVIISSIRTYIPSMKVYRRPYQEFTDIFNFAYLVKK